MENMNELLRKRSFVIFDHIPVGLEVGIDFRHWDVGQNFQGLKLIPSGFHILTLCIHGASSDSGPTTSLLFYIRPDEPQIIAVHFDQEHEVWSISMEPYAYRHDLERLDARLGPYPFVDDHFMTTWRALTSFISASLLNSVFSNVDQSLSIDPSHPPTLIYMITSMTASPYAALEMNESKLFPDKQTLSEDKLDENRDFIHFSMIDWKSSLIRKHTGALLTEKVLDKSFLLESFLVHSCLSDERELLGQIQLSFIILLICQNLEGLEHWKALLRLVCDSEKAIVKFPFLYKTTFDVLLAEFRQIPKEVSDTLLDSSNNIFSYLFQRLFSSIDDLPSSECKKLLMQKSENFRLEINRLFHWHLQRHLVTPEDEEPLIVESHHEFLNFTVSKISVWRRFSTVASLLLDKDEQDIKCLEGWVRHIRIQKNIAFLKINDGSNVDSIQCVSTPELALPVTLGSSVRLSGKWVKSPGKEQDMELHIENLSLIGTCATNEYPLQKKSHSLEYLRSIAHLRPRTSRMMSVLKIRNTAMMALHGFFQTQDYTHISTPIITSHDCEGGGEVFAVVPAISNSDATSRLSLSNPTKNEPRSFFGAPSYLTVSGQLHLETAAHAFRRVYTFGPTFRAEPHHTPRHLAEFWMLEAELSYIYSLDAILKEIESMLRYVVSQVIEKCPLELDVLFQLKDDNSCSLVTPSLSFMDELQKFLMTPFKRISYSDAVKTLRSALDSREVSFKYEVEWGKPLQTEHEQYIATVTFKSPVFITDYPAAVKPFYMRRSMTHVDMEVVSCVDLILPNFGELVGGSLREERYDELVKRMKSLNMSVDELDWYLELRKFGSVPHGGFGLGFERLVQFLTGTSNIRDVTLMPRVEGSLKY